MSEITNIIYYAVKKMSRCFGGVNIVIVDNEMINNGVTIVIDSGVKKHRMFLQHSLAEDICIYGENIANEIVFKIIKQDFVLLERKLKLDKINKL